MFVVPRVQSGPRGPVKYVPLAPHTRHSVCRGVKVTRGEPEQDPLKCWSPNRIPSLLDLRMEPSVGPAHPGMTPLDEVSSHAKGLLQGNMTATDTCCSIPSMPGTGL